MAEKSLYQTLNLSCICRKTTGFIKLPTHDLPLSFSFCHCNICRHQSGLLCNSYATLPKSSQFVVNGPIEVFKSSERVSRYFCNHCGANVYIEDGPDPDICTGVFEKADGIVELKTHIFVPDSRDGGLSDWIPSVDAYEGFSENSKVLNNDWKEHVKTTEPQSNSELQAYCQCKGVRFKITRPNESSDTLNVPPCDLSGPTEKWWLCENGTKYLAGTCACHSCRLASGFDIQAWAFVPKANILQLNGEPLDFKMGTLKRYNSSEGTYREFCSRCGATVFWHAERRPGLIDVSVGLLAAEEGARAESWLGWKTERVSFEEEAQNKALIEKLGTGLKEWGAVKGSEA